MDIKLTLVPLEMPADVNVILGQAHFIKTVEDVHEALVCAVPGIKFGLAFCEASGARLVRHSGTDSGLSELACRNVQAIGAGHSFIVYLRDCFPINVLPAIRQVPEVCGIFCASANPVQAVVAESAQGRGILGVIDGMPPVGVEDEADIKERKALVRKFGYKM